MPKAISAVIAVIMLLMITVALVGMSYVWMTALTTTTTQSGTQQVEQFIKQASNCMRIESAYSNKVVLFNCGIGTITKDSLSVYIDNIPVNISSDFSSIAENKRGTLSISGLWQLSLGEHSLRVSNGLTEVSKIVETIPHESALGVWKMDEDFLFSEATWSRDPAITQTTNTLFLYNGKPTLQFDGGCCRFWIPNSFVADKKIVLALYTPTGTSNIEMRNSYGPGYAPSANNWHTIVSSPCSPPCYAVPPAECSPPCRDPLGFGRAEVSDFNIWINGQRAYIGYASVVPTDTDASKVTTTIKDASGNGNMGTLFGGTTSVSGKFGKALSFDGVNDYVEVTTDVPEYNFTMVAWVKTTDSNGGVMNVIDGVIPCSNGCDRDIGVQNGMAYARVWQGAGWSTGKAVSDGTWHHWTLTVQSGVGQKFYIDGAQVGTFSYDHSDFNWQTKFIIGESADLGFLNGIIDNVMIFNRALLPDEIIWMKMK